MDIKDKEDIEYLRSLIDQRNKNPKNRAEINPKIREKLTTASNYAILRIVNTTGSQLAEKELLNRLKNQKISSLKELFRLLESGIFHQLAWNEIGRVGPTAPQEDIIEIVKEFAGSCFLEDHYGFAKAIGDRKDINEIVEKIKDIKIGYSDTSVILADLKFKRWQ